MSSERPVSPRTIGVAYAILTGLCWAVLAIGLKYALHFSSTGTIVWMRMVFAFTLLFLFYAFKKPKVIKNVFSKPPFTIVTAGLFLAFNYYGYMKGVELTTASNAQIMIQLGPLGLLFIGVFYFKELIRPAQWIGIFIAVVGFGFYNWEQIILSFERSDVYIAGNVWIILASFTWSIFAALQKVQLQRGWTPQMINLLIYAICCLALYPTAQVGELMSFSAWQWFVMFLLGLNTMVAYGALAEAVLRIPASSVSLIISVNPLLTIFLVEMIAQLGLTFVAPEPIMWRGYLGAALVVIGVATALSLRKRETRGRMRSG